MTVVTKIGLDAKTYYGAAGSSASTEMNIVREVTLNLAADDVVSGDRSSVFKSHGTGQIDATVDIVATCDTANAGYQALRDAFLNRTPLALKFLDKASGEGLDADFMVINMGRPEPLNGEIVSNFSVGINQSLRAPDWV